MRFVRSRLVLVPIVLLLLVVVLLLLVELVVLRGVPVRQCRGGGGLRERRGNSGDHPVPGILLHVLVVAAVVVLRRRDGLRHGADGAAQHRGRHRRGRERGEADLL